MEEISTALGPPDTSGAHGHGGQLVLLLVRVVNEIELGNATKRDIARGQIKRSKIATKMLTAKIMATVIITVMVITIFGACSVRDPMGKNENCGADHMLTVK